jgi:uncharacterized repeat protein (TIGR03803 family)
MKRPSAKTGFDSSLPPSAIIIALFSMMMMSDLLAQTFNSFYSFSGTDDGTAPNPGLIVSGSTLYGTASSGGAFANGTVFAVNTDGTGFSTLHSFSGGSGTSPLTNGDGIVPSSPVLSGNTLYASTLQGGVFGYGTVFKVNTDGTGFTNLHYFTAAPGTYATNSDGANPYGPLVLLGSTLYGTASGGGQSGFGTVFKVNTDGTGFAAIFSFPGGAVAGVPLAGLTTSGTTLYGTCSVGGNPSAGTVFAVNLDGTGFTNLHSFAATEGAYPKAGLILSGNTLYGTTYRGGASGIGTVFKVNTNGTGFATLHSFAGSSLPPYNAQGSYPQASLLLSGGALYGTAGLGGTWNWGTAFSVNTDGTGFLVLHVFANQADGAFPDSGFVQSGSILYGTAKSGGSSLNGTLFTFSFPTLQPLVTISRAGGSLILSWPASTSGFTLQSTTNLASPIWTTNLPAPVVANGQNTVTNPIPGTQQFFRLSQ